MSTATPARPSSRTPYRLPRAPISRRARAGEVLRGLVAALVLLAVVVGVPFALVELVGNPLPHNAPTRSWLDAELTASAVLDVLTVVLWLVWAHFVVCLLVETKAWIVGGRSGNVPLGGANQLAAQRLVAAVLLLASGAVGVPGVVQVVDAVPVSSTSAVPAVAAPGATSHATPASTPAAAPELGWTAQPRADPVLYLVQPPQGRHHDCLWDIAERTLGDPLRYHEIFELNQDRVQADGSRLVDADLIRPGWTLLLPADATGTTSVPLSQPASQPSSQPDVGWVGTPAATPVDEPGPTAAADDLVPRSASSGGMLLAGVLVALRRPGTPAAAGVAEALAGSADPDRVRFLDVALRRLAAVRAGAGFPLPDVVAAHLSNDELVLHLGVRGQGAAAVPPSPWTVLDGGAWRVLRSELLDTVSSEAVGPAPFPTLVDVARSGDHEVLLDLESAPGIVSVGGDHDVARDVVTSMAVELATNSWSDGVDVHLVGFSDDLSVLAPEHLRPHALLDEVLDGFERRGPATPAGTDLRPGRDGDRVRPGVIVVSGPPTEAQVERLRRLVSDGRTPVAVLCVGDVPSAGWRFAVSPDGTLDLGVLGVRGRARRLPPSEYAAWAEALRG